MSRVTFLFVFITLTQLVFAGGRCERDKQACGEITLGRPKLWTLDEAHYLVGGVREDLEQLRIAYPAEGLDPNAIHRRELEVLQRSLGIGVAFDQGAKQQAEDADRKFQQQSEDAAQAREELRSARSELADLQAQLAANEGETVQRNARKGQLEAALEANRARLAELTADDADDPPSDAVAALSAKIEAQENELDTVDRRLSELAGEKARLDAQIAAKEERITDLETRAAPPTRNQVQATDATLPTAGDLLLKNQTVRDALAARIKTILERDPRLHYTQVLDNLVEAHLQLISRRLTLLRQSLDPNYDLFFMELSSSLTPTRRAKHHIARVRWKMKVGEYHYDGMYDQLGLQPEDELDVLQMVPGDEEKVEILEQIREEGGGRKDAIDSAIATLRSRPQPFIFELTPSQSELNIASTHARAKNFGLLGVFKTLLGLGIQTQYQQQREQYGQFLERGVFVAGHGKGESVFGWDFAPMAGEQFVAPGNYTTYAVLAVPKWTRSVTFHTDWTWQKKPSKGGRDRLAPHFPKGRTAPSETVVLPTHKDYWVTGVDYRTVPQGSPITVLIRGRGFSTETELFVNHVPLERRMRLVEAEAEDEDPPEDAAEAAVSGAFEVLSSSLIAASFRCPACVGTPDLALVAPSKSIYLNSLHLTLNGDDETTQLKTLTATQGFFRPATAPLTGTIEFVETNPAAQTFSARVQLTGTLPKFHGTRRVSVYDGQGWQALDGGQAVFMPGRRQLQLTGVHSPSPLILRIDQIPPTSSHVRQTSLSGSNGAKAAQVELIETAAIPYRPIVESLSRISGPARGGEYVTLRGANLAEVESVLFGDRPAQLLSVGDGAIRLQVPAGSAGASVPVTAVSEVGSQTLTSTEEHAYTYDKNKKKSKKKK